jgi:hypothetical protein
MKRSAYGALRDVALQMPALRRLYDSRNALIIERDQLSAQVKASNQSPFFHYNSSFKPEDIIRRHAARGLQPFPGHVTNFLGVRIDPKFFPSILMGQEGKIEEIPIPANWHADIAEWGAALRAVDLAHGQFTVLELGCGWGCWMNNTGVAARRAGLRVHLIGVEGDEGHIGFAREACETNGFTPDQVNLNRGIAAPSSGTALFPRQVQAGMEWGLQPIFGATAEQRAAAASSSTHDELRMIALAELTAPHARIDLLHVDIQGGEADLIAGCLNVLNDKVSYLVVGTHSRQIEGRILDLLLQGGWVLEIERPAIFAIKHGSPNLTVDGVQGWRNPKLSPNATAPDCASAPRSPKAQPTSW